jgi:deoxyxylulose-5-phosphate synthase
MEIKNKIFLGGTCNDSSWRSELKYYLDDLGIDYFDPVVDNWTPECISIENDEKYNKCNIHLYVITSKMTGVYSIAEAVDSAWRTVEYLDEETEELSREIDRVVFIVLTGGFSEDQIKSFKATSSLISNITKNSLTKIGNCSMLDLSKLLRGLCYEIEDEYEEK